MNRDGDLHLEQYGHIATQEFIPSDELPLFHFKPNAYWARFGLKGCTMRCPFCTTYHVSQLGSVRSVPCEPAQLITAAHENGCRGLSFGYGEPGPHHEFVFDTFREAFTLGYDTHLETNGMYSDEPLREIAPFLSAVTVGLKGLDPDLYQNQLGGDVAEVLSTIDVLMTLRIHTEITWLLIPGVTDNPDSVRPLLEIAGHYGFAPPLILLPFRPFFQWSDKPSADLDHLEAFHAAIQHYPGAIYESHPLSSARNTCCENCGRPLIRRGEAGLILTKDGTGRSREHCPTCNTPVPYVVDDE